MTQTYTFKKFISYQRFSVAFAFDTTDVNTIHNCSVLQCVPDDIIYIIEQYRIYQWFSIKFLFGFIDICAIYNFVFRYTMLPSRYYF